MSVTPSADTTDKLAFNSNKLTQPEGCSSVRHLAERTTMHGCQNIIEAEYHVTRRVIWGLLLLGSAGLFLNAFIGGVLRYHSYPSTVSADIEPNKNLALPDVTVCNYYYLGRKSYMEAQSPAIQALIAGDISQTSSNNTPSFGRFIIDGLDPREQFISNCSLYLTGFSCAEIIGISFTWSGACYTLSLSDYVQRTSRVTDGLKIGISVDESEYTDPSFSPGMGIRLMLHEHGEMPNENLAVYIEPGTDVHIAVRKWRNVRLGTPYSSDDCMEGLEWDSELSSVYTKHGCEINCFFLYFLDHFDCHYSGQMNGTRACSLHEIIVNRSDALDYVDGGECRCLRPCEESIYSTDVTTLTHRETTGSYKKIAVNLYYSTFDVNVVTQSASYDINVFLADVGGQMGLFLGASVLTWSEILEFFLVYLVGKLVHWPKALKQ